MESKESKKLRVEVESWHGFHYALRAEHRVPWENMVEEAMAYREVIEESGRTFDTEAFFMVLLLVQQKRIEQLKERNEELRLLRKKARGQPPPPQGGGCDGGAPARGPSWVGNESTLTF